MGKILIIADTQGAEVKKSTYNVIQAGQALAAKLGIGYDIVAIGSTDVAAAGDELSKYGAQTVYTIGEERYQNYLAQPFAHAITQLANETQTTIVCGSANTTGKDVLPRIAAALGAGMVADCVGLVEEGGDLLFKRPMYAGNIIATVKVNTPNKVISFRTSEFGAAEPTDAASTVSSFAPDPADFDVRFISFDGTESERPDLGDAEIVVSGGRGLKDGDRFFSVLEPLADALGAAIGASRAAVDAGFCPNDLQVGQTGKVVAPDLYVAVAISGAIQHLAGMKNSKTIVAINTNGDEPIFQVSDYGLIADAFEAVPELVQKLS